MDKSNISMSPLQAMVQTTNVVFRWVIGTGVLCIEWLMGRRVMAVAAILCALFLATAPWVRPPISHDLRSSHIPLGLGGESYGEPDELVVKQRTWRMDSAAIPLFVVLGGGLVVVALRARFLTSVAGLSTSVGIVTVSACLFNHPVMIDWMDSELDQRVRIGQIVRLHQEHARAAAQPPRIKSLLENHAWFEPEGPLRGCVYSLYGPVFIAFSLLVMLVSSTDRWPRRLGKGFAYVLLGLLLAGVVTSRHWVAEYHLYQAQSAEFGNRFDQARRAIDSMLEVAPEYHVRPVTWALRGRLDIREGKSTVYSKYLRTKEWIEQDNLQQALFLSREIHGRQADCLAITELFCDIDALLAIERMGNKDLGNSIRYWVESHEVAPWRLDIHVGYALSLILSRENDPTRIEDILETLLDNMGDSLLISDLAALAADAYFEVGDFESAREYYRIALNTVKLPDQVNSHAQERMIGL